MRLSKKLITTGILQHAKVRHCSEWDFLETNSSSRFGGSALVRGVMNRRLGVQRAKGRGGFLALFGWIRRR